MTAKYTRRLTGSPGWISGKSDWFPQEASAFIQDMLPKTSRTFALNIPLLPQPLDGIVAMAYLLCRVADTIEDEADIQANARVGLLEEFGALVALPPDWRKSAETFTDRAIALLAGGASPDQERLVAGSPLLLGDLAGRPRPVRELVRICVQDMTAGMAGTLRRRESLRDRPSAPKDLDEVLDYCDIVAGTVGQMLTGLFAWHSAGVAAVLPELEPRAAAFGRALQMTNIIKDVRADSAEGRWWLPTSVLADCGIDDPEQLWDPARAVRSRGALRRMIAAAQREITEAVAYVEALPVADAAIRRFCVAPLLLAVLTLRKQWETGGAFGAVPIKVSRGAVRAALLATRAGAVRPAALSALFAALRQPLPGPLPPREAPEALPVTGPDRTIDEAIEAAVARLAATQSPSGSWHEDYGNVPPFLSVYVITCYVVGAMPDEQTGARMEYYFRTHQNPDGGWGMDTESHSQVLASVLAYTALRLLGVSASDSCLERGRAWFLAQGGALAAPQWAKIFLAVLGVYDWKGLYPLVPELWLLPPKLRVHPSRMWAFTRQVFLAASWLYARRAVTNDDALLQELRSELYPLPYDHINWFKARGQIAATDAYRPRSWLLKAMFAACSIYEARPARKLRGRAMDTVLDNIDHENRYSNYVGHGPIPKVFHTLVWHFARPGGEEVTAHIARLPDYLWDAADGTKVQCFDSCDSWNTAFAVQALAQSHHPVSRRALQAAAWFLDRNQRLTDIPHADRYFRHPGRGGWTLSTAEQGWTISDGTAEALMAVLSLDDLGLADEFTAERRLDAVECLLSLQNPDGGWPVFEPRRAPTWLEKLNFSDTFDTLIIDHSHVEQSASCLTALRRYRARHPQLLCPALDSAIRRGEEFLLRKQRPDGSWEGIWGVCFTYGTWFGVRGLTGSQDPHAQAAIDRACEFLLAHQRADGGWGETIDGCRARRYIHAGTSQAAMTSWALLALVDAGRATSPAAHRAIGFLRRAQLADGGWRDHHMSGAFLRSTAMNYDIYQRLFPLWALSSYAYAASRNGETTPLGKLPEAPARTRP
jgi:squalene/oxidosqualene cyclase-like protein